MTTSGHYGLCTCEVQSPHLYTRRAFACRQYFYKANSRIELQEEQVYGLYITLPEQSPRRSVPVDLVPTTPPKRATPPPTPTYNPGGPFNLRTRKKLAKVWTLSASSACWQNERFVRLCVCVCTVYYCVVQVQPPTAVCLRVVKPEIRFDQFQHVA